MEAVFSALDSEQKEMFIGLSRECVSVMYLFLALKHAVQSRPVEGYSPELAIQLRADKSHEGCLSYMLQWYSSLKEDRQFLGQLSDAAKRSGNYEDALLYLSQVMQKK